MSKENFFTLICLLIVPAIGLLDQVSGDDLSLTALYLVPIALATWKGGAVRGGLVALEGLGAWAVANLAFPAHVDIDTGVIEGWGVAEKGLYFALAAFLTWKLRAYAEAERMKGLADFATGLPNRRAFAADFAAAQARGEPVEVGFIELAGLEELYLDRGEAFVESLFKAAADRARAAVPTYRFGDERLAFIKAGAREGETEASMRRLAEELEEEVLAPRGLALEPKIGIARCAAPGRAVAGQLRKFLEGSMTFLRGKSGPQVEAFEFVKP